MGINREYFSGSQASLFIGDVWVDDIVEINYSDTYSAKPIFGYGSTWYDHVAEGREIIQGSFTVNFREPNYIWMILSMYKGNANTFKNTVKGGEDQYELYSTDNPSGLLQDKRANLDLFFNAKDPRTAEGTIRNKKNIGNTKLDKAYSDFSYPTFDILLGYGHTLNSESPGERLAGCKIVGKARTIMADGQPIREVYQFFAKKQE